MIPAAEYGACPNPKCDPDDKNVHHSWPLPDGSMQCYHRLYHKISESECASYQKNHRTQADCEAENGVWTKTDQDTLQARILKPLMTEMIRN
jgi:hypothetical protein